MELKEDQKFNKKQREEMKEIICNDAEKKAHDFLLKHKHDKY